MAGLSGPLTEAPPRTVDLAASSAPGLASGPVRHAKPAWASLLEPGYAPDPPAAAHDPAPLPALPARVPPAASAQPAPPRPLAQRMPKAPEPAGAGPPAANGSPRMGQTQAGSILASLSGATAAAPMAPAPQLAPQPAPQPKPLAPVSSGPASQMAAALSGPAASAARALSSLAGGPAKMTPSGTEQSAVAAPAPGPASGGVVTKASADWDPHADDILPGKAKGARFRH
jgi:hypothetical protein